MRVANFLVGLFSLLLGSLFLLVIVLYYAGVVDQSHDEYILVFFDFVTLYAILMIPLLYLASFIKRKLDPALWVLPVSLIIAASLATIMGTGMVLTTGIELKALALSDAIGLKRLAVLILNSPKLFLVAYFLWAFGWLGLSAALKPVVAADKSIRAFRTFCALTGLAYVSVVGVALAAVFMPLAYCSLGLFLIGTRLGSEDKSKLKFLDDYRPA